MLCGVGGCYVEIEGHEGKDKMSGSRDSVGVALDMFEKREGCRSG